LDYKRDYGSLHARGNGKKGRKGFHSPSLPRGKGERNEENTIAFFTEKVAALNKNNSPSWITMEKGEGKGNKLHLVSEKKEGEKKKERNLTHENHLKAGRTISRA